MGAMLLDRDEPRRALGRPAEPLIEPWGDERDGYLPTSSMAAVRWLVSATSSDRRRQDRETVFAVPATSPCRSGRSGRNPWSR